MPDYDPYAAMRADILSGARYPTVSPDLLGGIRRQATTNPLGFIPPHLLEMGKRAAMLAQFFGPLADAADVRDYQDNAQSMARNLMGGNYMQGMLKDAPRAAASALALAVPMVGGVSGKASDIVGAFNVSRVEKALSDHGVSYRKDVSKLTNGFPSHYYYVKKPDGTDIKLRVADHLGYPMENQIDLHETGLGGLHRLFGELGIETKDLDILAAHGALEEKRRQSMEALKKTTDRIDNEIALRDQNDAILETFGYSHLTGLERRRALRKLKK